MRRTVWLAGGLGLAAVLALGGWRFLGAETTAPPAAELARGQQLYAAHCASCHGADGEGQANWRSRRADGRLPAPPLNGDGHTWHHPDEQLIAIIAHGVEAFAPAGYRSDMAGFADRLSRAEIRQVLAYLKSTWPADKLARQQAITERASGG
jgi:mono/diheme cytochrome c family protein